VTPAVMVNAAVVGVPSPIPKKVAPPFCVTRQSPGAAASVAEKLTVAMVPVVAVPPTIVSSPRELVQVYPEAQATEVTFVPAVYVGVPLGMERPV
jgi:hypothetical protein